MNPMFDITKPAIVLMDTGRLQRLLENNTDPDDRKFIINGWIADQNKNSRHIVSTMEADTFANIIAMETFPKLTTEQFAKLMGALAVLAQTDPELAAIVQKLKQYNGVPSLQTCFDAEGFSSDSIAKIPELAGYKCELHLSSQIRVVPNTHDE